MRKLTVAAFVSLDGVMQGPGGPDEDRDGDFPFGGWVEPHFDEAGGDVIAELFEKPFDLLLGRRTYDIFAAYWPQREGEMLIADQFGDANKYVATRDPGFESRWRNTQRLEGDAVEAVRTLKAESGRDLLTQGSAAFLQDLFASDLVDEIQVMTFPVVLGPGKRLFEGGAAPTGLKLVHSRTTPAGVIIARYARDGEVRTGSFAD